MFLLSFLFGFIIYSWSYYQIGNTIHRIDSNGKKRWDLTQLITNGFYGPIRFGYLCYCDNKLNIYIKNFFFQKHNPWFIIPFIIVILHHPLRILSQYLQ